MILVGGLYSANTFVFVLNVVDLLVLGGRGRRSVWCGRFIKTSATPAIRSMHQSGFCRIEYARRARHNSIRGIHHINKSPLNIILNDVEEHELRQLPAVNTAFIRLYMHQFCALCVKIPSQIEALFDRMPS
jgi:hypothetical protein